MFRRNEPEEPDEEETPEEEEDEDQQLDDIDTWFRQHASRVRHCSDLEDLADLRSEFTSLTTDRSTPQAARLRARDLVRLAGDRIAEVRTRRITGGR